MTTPCGRFAPSPSGRMHLGNLFSCLLAWLSVRSQGGRMILRIEDLDEGRCRPEYAEALMDDLRWLGLDWDEGPFYQSRRRALYDACFDRLSALGLVYPCYCTRAQRLAASAPHREDGAVVYDGRCRALTQAQRDQYAREGRAPAWRAAVPDETVCFTDGCRGNFRQALAREWGDFIVRRSDGGYAYQLAVTADDCDMGVTQVVRGADLLSSTPCQIWLARTLGFAPPAHYHVPLLLAPDGRRLSKRERDLDMEALRARCSPAELTGYLAFLAGLLPEPRALSAAALLPLFSWDRVKKADVTVGETQLLSR